MRFSHWIAFLLLVFIGVGMLKEAFDKKEEEQDSSLGFKTMILLAVATSIDAFAAGITFVCVPLHLSGLLNEVFNTLLGAGIIGIITFIFSGAGVRIGNIFGVKYKEKAQITGGIILIILGIKILAEHYIQI